MARRLLRRRGGWTKLTDLGKANAESVVEGDGWMMLVAAIPYSGAAPLYSQLELALDPRSDIALGKILGVDRQRVRRWRTSAIFCPLTGVRLRLNRGNPVLTPAYRAEN